MLWGASELKAIFTTKVRAGNIRKQVRCRKWIEMRKPGLQWVLHWNLAICKYSGRIGVEQPRMQIYSRSHMHLPDVTHQRRVVKEAVSHSGEEGEEGVSETHLWTAQVCESTHKVKHWDIQDWAGMTTGNLLFWSRRSSGEWCRSLRRPSMFHWTGLHIHKNSATHKETQQVDLSWFKYKLDGKKQAGSFCNFGLSIMSGIPQMVLIRWWIRTHRVPHDDVNVWAEGVVDVLGYVKVNKVTEVMVHVHSWRQQHTNTLATYSHTLAKSVFSQWGR